MGILSQRMNTPSHFCSIKNELRKDVLNKRRNEQQQKTERILSLYSFDFFFFTFCVDFPFFPILFGCVNMHFYIIFCSCCLSVVHCDFSAPDRNGSEKESV